MAKHRTLIIGVGSIGERHLRCFKNTGRAELSLCEINEELRETVGQRYGVLHAYADLDAALAAEFDVAAVCVPAHLHVEMFTRLAEAGIHVLCEKPLSTSMDGIDRLRETVARKGVVAAVGYNWRCHPVIADVKAALESGQFGDPLHLAVVNGSDFAYHRPAYREVYFNNRFTGGGAIQDAITHIFNLAEWLIGPIDCLAVDAAHQKLDGVEVEDTVNTIARHGRVLASYALNLFQARSETSFTIVCEKATIRIEPHAWRWRWAVKPQEPWHDVLSESCERDHLYVTQAGVFLDAIEGKGSVRCTLEEGIQTLRVNLAALEAADTKTWQPVK